jgi:hypothetical protein
MEVCSDAKGAVVLALLANLNRTPLFWRNVLLVLNLGLHVVDCVGRFNVIVLPGVTGT